MNARINPCEAEHCDRLIVHSRRAVDAAVGLYRHAGFGYCIRCYHRFINGTLTFDEVAVERAVHGDTPGRLTLRERRAAIEKLNRRGLPAGEIARRVGCSPRTVFRYRARDERAA